MDGPWTMDGWTMDGPWTMNAPSVEKTHAKTVKNNLKQVKNIEQSVSVQPPHRGILVLDQGELMHHGPWMPSWVIFDTASGDLSRVMGPPLWAQHTVPGAKKKLIDHPTKPIRKTSRNLDKPSKKHPNT